MEESCNLFFFLTVILRDTQTAKLWDEAVKLRLQVVCNFHSRKACLWSLGYCRASLNVRQLFSISSFLRIPPSLPLINSSTVVGWVVDAVSKEHTMLHQNTRNPRWQALSTVCAQEYGLTCQNWSNVLFLWSQTAMCLVWAGAPHTHRRAVALPGEQHSSLEKSLVS